MMIANSANQFRQVERDRREVADRDREHRAADADDGAAPARSASTM